MINQEYLKERLRYDQETGLFFWRSRSRSSFSDSGRFNWWNSRYSGKRVGCLDSGYLVVNLDKTNHYLHRLAWMYVHGYLPSGQIDHKNGIRSDNRISNLRDVSHQENGKNQKFNSSNTSGSIGVHLHKRSGKWHAQITDGGKKIYLGLFTDISEAIAARRKAESNLGFHENHGKHLPQQ